MKIIGLLALVAPMIAWPLGAGIMSSAADTTIHESRLATPVSQDECRDRIRMVREKRGLPERERDTASLDEVYFLAAVDRQIDGCDVIVMRGNPDDIRSLPAMPDGPVELIPAR